MFLLIVSTLLFQEQMPFDPYQDRLLLPWVVENQNYHSQLVFQNLSEDTLMLYCIAYRKDRSLWPPSDEETFSSQILTLKPDETLVTTPSQLFPENYLGRGFSLVIRSNVSDVSCDVFISHNSGGVPTVLSAVPIEDIPDCDPQKFCVQTLSGISMDELGSAINLVNIGPDENPITMLFFDGTGRQVAVMEDIYRWPRFFPFATMLHPWLTDHSGPLSAEIQSKHPVIVSHFHFNEHAQPSAQLSDPSDFDCWDFLPFEFPTLEHVSEDGLSEELRDRYKIGANILTLRHLRNSYGQYCVGRDAILPSGLKDAIYRAMVAVYHATHVPERNAVVHYEILPLPAWIPKTLILCINSEATWLNTWRTGGTETGNMELNQLLEKYDFKLDKLHESPTFTWGILKTLESWNLWGVGREFMALDDIYCAEPDRSIGDSCDIQVQILPDHFVLDYRLAWGDCPSGCFNNHYWRFEVLQDASVHFIEEWGDPYDSVRRCE